ncbi:MAG TPA: ABC transporter permease [Tepidisphaeraceae bacterium]|nr:ABC transporter permease [Tepidisphaeraceae bacterium]
MNLQSTEKSGFGTQTGALLVDAYRDLQSRKLFWLTLVLSLLVAGIFGLVGINENGISIAGRTLRGTPFNSNLIAPAEFFKLMYTTLAIPVWLGFLATALALVSVGGLFPEMITSGSIELYLSRPIGRLRLFLTKYVFALLFTALQVLLFSAVSFIVIGLRGGIWEFRIFLAVPLVTLFFSYLYCFCVLLGIVTRSTLASILFTVIFWGFLYVIHVADLQLTTFSAAAEQRVAHQQQLIQMNQKLIDQNAGLPADRRGNMTAFEFQRDKQRESLADYQQTADELRWWQRLILTINTPLPKTNETISLMNRWLISPDAMTAVEDDQRQRREAFRARIGATSRPGENVRQFVDTAETQQQIDEEYGGRKVARIIGTSLGFEAAILGLAAWVFCRRDY